jgi:phosphoglycerate kinase
MKLRTIDEVGGVSGKKVLLRLSLNVPIQDGLVTDDFRLQRVLPTLSTLIERGASVTVISHLGDGTQSLDPVEVYLREHVKGDFKVLPNLRRDPREEAGDMSLVHELAREQDIFVNEDFAVAHRPHASVVGLPKVLPSFAGCQFAQEVEQLSRFVSPPKGSVLVLGGAKLSTKLPLIEAFLPKVEHIFLGSYYVYEKDRLPKDDKIVLPIDLTEDKGAFVDVGPQTLQMMRQAVLCANTVIWNGPLGKFEEGYSDTTESLAEAIATSECQSVVGGGDSVAAIRKLELLDKFTFVSTGGGAMLDFLTHGTLPGIEAILESNYQRNE